MCDLSLVQLFNNSTWCKMRAGDKAELTIEIRIERWAFTEVMLSVPLAM